MLETISLAQATCGSEISAPDVPLSTLRDVTLRLTLDCNLRCIMCDHPLRPKSRMAYEVARSVLDQIPATARATFIGGEPCLWFLKYPDVLRSAIESGRPVGMVTNAILVPRLPDLVEAFRTRNISVQISIDGYEQTYEQVRIRSSWLQLVESIRLMHRTRTEAGNKRARINVNYLLMERTLDDLPEFVRFCAAEGIDELRLTYTMIYDSMVKRGAITEQESVYYHRERTNEVMGEAVDVALQEGITLKYPPPIGRPEIKGEQCAGLRAAGGGAKPHPYGKTVPCDKPWTSLWIYQDGSIRPCCCGVHGPLVGYIEEGIESIWNGPRMKEVRAAMMGGQLHSSCGCGINLSHLANQSGEEHFFSRVRQEKKRTEADKLLHTAG